ncbi:hypothetical protein LSAT2_023060 [Lamellibrachia satsuma]|nr:hypothetical protein LSAT2_023060 [Lamellibrachia satsuma]
MDIMALKLIELLMEEHVLTKLRRALYPQEIADKIYAVRDVDCFTGNGLDYKGTINRSKSGRICKEWTDQSAKCAGALKQSKTDAKNYCRSTNATGCQKRRPYCYVTDPDKTWEYCSVPKCVDKFAGDGLSALNSYAFSTNDKKTTDARAKTGCPADRGGWWHGAECSGANLNGKFLKTGAPTDSHIQWRTATTGPLMSVSIMIRPIG